MTVLLPISYFPPIQYFVCLLKSDEVYIEQHEHYVKQTHRNRADIYSPNGLLSLSIPVIKINGNKTLIKDIRISYHSNWQTIHWRSIETAYNSSPYFLYYKDEIYPFFNQKYDNLFEYNLQILHKILELIRINKQIKFTESYTPPHLKSEQGWGDILDFRNLISPKYKLRTPNSGFITHNSELITLNYFQVFSHKHGFLPNLSILDLLFNLGPSSLEYLTNSFPNHEVILCV